MEFTINKTIKTSNKPIQMIHNHNLREVQRKKSARSYRIDRLREAMLKSDISGVIWLIKELLTQVKKQGWGGGLESPEQTAQRLWGQEEQRRTMFLKCWERWLIWLKLRLKRQESQGPGQATSCVDLGLKCKWDGNVVIWFLCNGLEGTKGEANRPLRRIL